LPEVLGGVVEVENDRLDTPEVAVHPVFQPAAAVAQGDPALGPIHPHLRRLSPERFAQSRAAAQPRGGAGRAPWRRAVRPHPASRVWEDAPHRSANAPSSGTGGDRHSSSASSSYTSRLALPRISRSFSSVSGLPSMAA